jgi:hypothetical protein
MSPWRASCRSRPFRSEVRHRGSKLRSALRRPQIVRKTLYSKVGFRPLFEERLPAFLQSRAERYRAKGETISPMLRNGGLEDVHSERAVQLTLGSP